MGGVKQVRQSSICNWEGSVLMAIAQDLLEANKEFNKSSEECQPLFDLILIW